PRQVTAWTFAAMTGGAAVVLAASRCRLARVVHRRVRRAVRALGHRQRLDVQDDPRRVPRRGGRSDRRRCRRRGVNLVLRQSFLDRGDGDAAYFAFGAFYVVCLAVTVAVYRRGERAEVV